MNWNVNARGVAAHVVYLCEEKNLYSNVAWSEAISGDEEMASRDKRFAMEIAMGTVRNKLTLDWIIEECSTRKIKKIDPVVLSILRTGVYQIIYMSSVPSHSAVDESVALSKKLRSGHASGFINAVLRKSSKFNLQSALDASGMDEVSKISVKYSFPKWIVERWIESYGVEGAISMCLYSNADPSVSIRLNTTKGDVEEIVSKLEEDGIETSEGLYLKECRKAVVEKNLNLYESFAQGFFTVQDESSSFVAHVLDPKPGFVILDVCSAPGGKTTHLAELMGDEGEILACDLNEERLEMVNQSAKRLGLKSVKTAAMDGADIPEEYFHRMDAVLVDAPCSGLGVLSRRADSRWRKSPEDISSLAKIQRDILESASKCVKPGGILVYSTCTDTMEENQDQIRKFLKRHSEFYPSPVKGHLSFVNKPLANLGDNDHQIQLLPHIHGVDGFFICRMQRKLN